MKDFAQFVLASASPRRAELLQSLGLNFIVSAQDIDESGLRDEAVERHVLRLAREKAIAAGNAALPVLGADTVVVVNGETLGKPKHRNDMLRMFAALSGQTHQVMTAVAMVQDGCCEQALSISEVTFRQVGRLEVEAYWATGEPRDKAGGYAIQGLGAIFVERLTGSYSGVVGLPLYETSQLLGNFGINVLSAKND